jgi:hypothetical protein
MIRPTRRFDREGFHGAALATVMTWVALGAGCSDQAQPQTSYVNPDFFGHPCEESEDCGFIEILMNEKRCAFHRTTMQCLASRSLDQDCVFLIPTLEGQLNEKRVEEGLEPVSMTAVACTVSRTCVLSVPVPASDPHPWHDLACEASSNGGVDGGSPDAGGGEA